MRFPWSSASPRVRYKPLVRVPFVGQEALLSALDTRLQAARQGTSQYVILEGPNGSGKSALLTEFTLLFCRSAHVLVVRLNVNDCIFEGECYGRLCDALQARSEDILKRLFNDTKRLRKTLGVDWDEAAFRTFLVSADWNQQPHEAAADARATVGRADALARLLGLVREHPWGVGAATILEMMRRGASSAWRQPAWAQRWSTLLQAIQRRGLASGAVLVVLCDQFDTSLLHNDEARQRWLHFWPTFVTAIEASGLPLLLLWAGTADGADLVRQALAGSIPLTTYTLEALTVDEQQQLLQRLQRALPRDYRESWQRAVTAAGEALRSPGRLLLATTCVAALGDAEVRTEETPETLVQADTSRLVHHLVQASGRRHPTQAALFHELLEVCAVLPPGKEWVLDDLFPLCDLETLGFDPVSGRTALESLLGQCVRYGLLFYDPYTARYTTAHGMIQEALQRLLYPEDTRRHEVMWRRRLAMVLLHHLQRGEREGLAELQRVLAAAEYAALSTTLPASVIPPFRRVLRMLTKMERQQVATTLEAFPSPLAVDLLRLLLSDAEDQVRSRVVQSLANLQDLDTFSVLRDALKDKNSDVRWIAAAALSKVDGAATVDALIPLLTDEDKEVGRIAAEGLGQRGDRRAVPHLIAAARDSYPLLRESAAQALGQLADRRAVPALQELLQDTSQQVRRRAEEALARFSMSIC
jgi:ABC-type cobalamin/Fe3+-siderophores transport system ATPase subunit